MKTFLMVMLAVVLGGCATAPSTPRQAAVEADLDACIAGIGNGRGISYTVNPDGAWRTRYTGGGDVSIAASRALVTCMVAKGHQVNGETRR